jgi:hypothetical protein
VGPEGVCSTANCKLPKGVTETGVWAARPAENETQVYPISFAIPLASELDSSHVHIAPNAACSGTAQEPKAESGNLCLYIGENFVDNVELQGIDKPYELTEGTGRSGAVLTALGLGVPALAAGSWAVTG